MQLAMDYRIAGHCLPEEYLFSTTFRELALLPSHVVGYYTGRFLQILFYKFEFNNNGWDRI
jgi:hypothetical protein